MQNSFTVPPNPYTLHPIIKPSFLAGRAEELNQIDYYLSLTRAGQSHHLALIGERGVGKTSLLNSAESLASAKSLLPVRIQMNEDKGRSPGRFWADFYSSLCLAVAKAGCWGGLAGPLYESLFTMIHARQKVPLSMAVLQFPYAMASHHGNIDELLCSDALILNDIVTTLEELRANDLKGLVILIDEANCLGSNRPLIQMLRNIFQMLEGCSIMLAGTEDVFPTLTEVFSPIPRQFHRISVKRFSHWADSRELIVKPFSNPAFEAFTDVSPDVDTSFHLHQLCDGDPSELQLYCHHMYKLLEEGVTDRMILQPQVFRSVLSAYRLTTPSNLESVLSAIEKLPDRLLYKSKWFRWKRLSSDDNIKRAIFAGELKNARSLSEAEEIGLATKIKRSYKELLEAGITYSDSHLELIGGSLTAGFWKSYVEVEKEERWLWRDDDFDDSIFFTVMNSVLYRTEANVANIVTEKSGAIEGLNSIRVGGEIQDIKPHGVSDLMTVTMYARGKGLRTSTDITIEMFKGNASKKFRFWYLPGGDEIPKRVEDYFENRKEILDKNGMTANIVGVRTFELPSDEEMHRLGRISNISIPEDEFGPSEYKIALRKYFNGDIQGTIDLFERMIADKDQSQIRNNLAFCLILNGQLVEAKSHLEYALDNNVWDKKNYGPSYNPIMDNNYAMVLYLLGDKAAAPKILNRGLSWINQNKDKSYKDDTADVVLILDNDRQGVLPHVGTTVEAALYLNLYLMEQMSFDDLTSILQRLNPEKYAAWLELVKLGQEGISSRDVGLTP